MTKPQYSIAIAGSTAHTRLCAQAFLQNPNFIISWVLTPQPRKSGRKQILTKNPLQQFAEENKIKTILLEKKVNQQVKQQIEQSKKPDFLLVVDFGYIAPQWLLNIPRIAPINIHPSILPTWRGSSPGQFVLLTGEKKSAISVIKMNDKLDEGELIHQEFFKVQAHWTQQDYYIYSFHLISQLLPQIISQYAQGKIEAKTQPLKSPTPVARRLTKQDAFIEWRLLKKVMTGEKIALNQKILGKNGLLALFKYALPNIKKIEAKNLVQACYALQPWPVMWTIAPTPKGNKRIKIFSCQNKNSVLELGEIQIEGKNKANFKQLSAYLLSSSG